MFEHRQFLRSLKISSMILIAQRRKVVTGINNYRLIALTNCLCKLLEGILNIRLTRTLELTNSYNEIQCRFSAK